MTQTSPFATPVHPGHFYEVCARCATHLGGCKCLSPLKERRERPGSCQACQDLSDTQAASLRATNLAL